MTWPVGVIWGLVAAALILRRNFMLDLFSVTMAFGSLSMLPPALGMNLLPQTLCAVVLIVLTILRRDELLRMARLAFDMKSLGFLFLFAAYAVFSAFFLPHLFAGQVMVVSLDNALRGASPLMPSATNISQTFYLLVSVATAFVFAIKAENENFRRDYLRSLLAAAMVLVASGVLDLLASECGHADLMQPFHNAAYALLTDTSVAGQKRVVGFMAEASSYGFACVQLLSILVCCFSHFSQKERRGIVPVMIAGLAVMAFLSTSSTALAGAGILGLILLPRLFRQVAAVLRGKAKCVFWMFMACGCLVVAYVAVAAFAPAVLASLYQVVNVSILQKSGSDSYMVRHMWTQYAMSAFLKTDGLGVGIGAARTSNWYVNVAASTGIIGVMLLAAVIGAAMLALWRRGQNEQVRLGRGLALAFIPITAMMGLAGTTPDPGALNMAALGVIVAVSRQGQKETAKNEGDLAAGCNL